MAQQRSGRQLAAGVVLGFLVATALAIGVRMGAQPGLPPQAPGREVPEGLKGSRELGPQDRLNLGDPRQMNLEDRLRTRTDAGS